MNTDERDSLLALLREFVIPVYETRAFDEALTAMKTDAAVERLRDEKETKA